MDVIDHPDVRQRTRIIVDHGLVHHRIVLRYDSGSVQPWVTCFENLKVTKLNENGGVLEHDSFYWGEYFDTEAEAEKSFKLRKAKL